MTRVGSLWLLTALLYAQPAPVKNFYKVDDRVLRGAQPSAAEFEELSRMKVKTVLDLRTGEQRGEKEIVERLGIRYIQEPLSAVSAPDNQQIGKILKLLATEPAPIFVHCLRGKDRTGTVIACYRMAFHKWENSRALEEARHFGMSWLEWGMRKYIQRFEPRQVQWQ
jgi:tyrosine-protein phosphatase SIW14